MVMNQNVSCALLIYLFLLQVINSAMHKERIELCIGVLDIYGFEIFEVS